MSLDNHERHVAINEGEKIVNVVVVVVVVGNYLWKVFFSCKLAPLKHSLVVLIEFYGSGKRR